MSSISHTLSSPRVATTLSLTLMSLRAPAAAYRKPPATRLVACLVDIPATFKVNGLGLSTERTRRASMNSGATLSRSRICFSKRPTVPARCTCVCTASDCARERDLYGNVEVMCDLPPLLRHRRRRDCLTAWRARPRSICRPLPAQPLRAAASIGVPQPQAW